MNDHTEVGAVAEVLARLDRGERVAVVSDAGMPGISDPGERLVAAAAAAGHTVEVVPGPSAAIAGLVLSGLATGRFVFEGFLPRKGSGRIRAARRAGRRAAHDRALRGAPPPGPHPGRPGAPPSARPRRVVLARELTKLHEEVWRGTLARAVERCAEVEPRGEYVVVVAGAPAPVAATDDELAEAVAEEIRAGRSTRDAVALVSGRFDVSRRRVYDLANRS